MALWVFIVVAALVLRVARLDMAPLSGREARQALSAWEAVTGQGMPEGGYSPLLFVVNALLFALCGAGDGLARLGPALSGAALAFTPFLFRQRIGRAGALAAGLYLAISPTALFASRQLDGAVVAALGVMAFLGGLVRFLDAAGSTDADTDGHPWLVLSAVGLALAVTSSPSAYSLLATLGLAWLILAWAWPGEGLFSLPSASRDMSRGGLYARYIGHVRRVAPVFLLAVLAFSTGLGWNPAGLGAVGDLLVAWGARFRPVLDAGVSPFALVAIYEPLALLFCLGGLAWVVIRRGHRFGALLGLWVGLGALMLALMPGRTPLDVLWVVLPLTLLAGMAAHQFIQNLRRQGEWLVEGLYVPVVVILWGHLCLVLGRYAVFGNPADLALIAVAVSLQAFMVILFAMTMGTGPAWRGFAVGTGLVLMGFTFSAGWGVAHVRPADPRELLVHRPTAVEVRDLVGTLQALSWRETGLPTTLSFDLELGPRFGAASEGSEDDAGLVLAWYLRDFSAARWVDGLAAGDEVGTVLVTPRRELSGLPVGGEEYVGQDFVLRRQWDPLDIACVWEWPPSCQAAIRWLLYRETPSPPAADRWAALWLREGRASVAGLEGPE